MIEPRKIPDPGWLSLYTKQTPIAELARKLPGRRLVSLNPHLDLEWMEEACRQTRKDGAAGVDGMTWEEYSRTLPARRRYFEIARGSALECGAVQDVLQVCGAMGADENRKAKALLDRTVAMLTKPGQRGYAVQEESGEYRTDRIDPGTDSDPDPDGNGGRQGRQPEGSGDSQ